nr:MAG TPA: hypothetical protein [Caudoviricetes sp.]
MTSFEKSEAMPVAFLPTRTGYVIYVLRHAVVRK